jgi:hypothetical protein
LIRRTGNHEKKHQKDHDGGFAGVDADVNADGGAGGGRTPTRREKAGRSKSYRRDRRKC